MLDIVTADAHRRINLSKGRNIYMSNQEGNAFRYFIKGQKNAIQKQANKSHKRVMYGFDSIESKKYTST